MDAYSATVRCEAGDERYASSLSLRDRGGPAEERSSGARSSRRAATPARSPSLQQQPLERRAEARRAARCSVTLREVGEYVKVAAGRLRRSCAARRPISSRCWSTGAAAAGCCGPRRSERDGLGNRRRHRDAHAAADAEQDVLRRLDRVRRAAEHAGFGGRHRAARHAAGRQPRRGRARHPLRPGGRRATSAAARSSRARTTSIPTCRRATRSASTRSRSCRAAKSRSSSMGPRRTIRADPRPPRGGRRQVAARGLPRHDRHRPEPRRHAAARDRDRARAARREGSGRLRPRAAFAGAPGSASATATCRKAPSAATRTSRSGRPATASSARAARSRT